MKYIDAEKLIAEIERRLKNIRVYINGAGMKYKGPKFYKARGKESAYDAILNIITSLQQEQPEVDFEKELKNEMTKLLDAFGPMNGEQCLAIRNFARHFYLGRTRKEE